MQLRTFALAACCTLLAIPGLAQTSGQVNHEMGEMNMDKPSGKALPSPAAKAEVTLNGKAITIKYNSPRVRGRKIMGGLVPYGKVWRTGANPATTLITETNLKIGTLDVPAGTYTLYTLPNADHWLLIVNKHTGQWGTEYTESDDLGRTPLTGKSLSAPQENMTISFENTHGDSTELHIKWETTDESVSVKAE
ncbi:MAG: DUF2911 domain-containing protein [Acidobacteriota bacterium]|nr:DUF2911 domain-containing protein [Acidobacteriota bacterium]